MDKCLVRWIFALGCCLSSGCHWSGCQQKSPAPPPPRRASHPYPIGSSGTGWVDKNNPAKPGPIPGIDHASINFGMMGEGAAFVVWTDIHTASGGGGVRGGYPDYENVKYRIQQSRHGKTLVEVQCTTPDGKSGWLVLNGKKLDLADGSLILVATGGPEIRAAQLRRDTLHMKLTQQAFQELAQTDAEIRAFFTQTPPPAEKPEPM